MSKDRVRRRARVPAALTALMSVVTGLTAALVVTPTVAQEARPTIHYINGARADAPIPRPGMVLVKGQVALVVTDPQNDFLSPKGVARGAVGKSVVANNAVENIGALFESAKQAGVPVFISPHKVFGPQTNDLMLQLRKAGVTQVVLAGMSANLCVESHMRDLLEEGFNVVIAGDATAAAQFPGYDGYKAAFVNYRFLASDVWSSAETTARFAKLK